MAKNGHVGDSHRNGAVRQRTQIFNPLTGNYIKRDSVTGRFIDVKSDGKAFKGITKERRITKVSTSISTSTALKAEQSVILTINARSN
ncbi:MAG: hypothetical protein LH615_08200 [Ferruginibacter sp.]|nr:hypothetical protein [Ferruginibacter sp.]